MKNKFMRMGFIVAVLVLAIVGLGVNWQFISLSVKTNFFVGANVAGTHAFTTTAIRDTVTFTTGVVKSTDIWILTAQNDTATIGLSYIAKNDTLIAIRKASGGSGTTYTYQRMIKR